MSTDDQKRASELHGEAHKAARDQVPQEVLDRLAAPPMGATTSASAPLER